jgi:lipopolysaccharide transport system permease protein
MVVDGLNNLYKYRDLIWQLTLRNIKASNKQSLLGISWIVIQPLSQMAVFTLIFTIFVKIPSEGIPYPVFSFVALLVWNYFSALVNSATNSVVEHNNLVRKIYFPREILVYSAGWTSLVNLSINFLVLGLLMTFYGIAPKIQAMWIIPIIVNTTILGTGVALFLAALNVFWRDTSRAAGLALQIWFYATPVIYSEASVPEWLLPYYRLNPMVGVVSGARSVLIKGVVPDLEALGIAAIIGVLFFAAGLWFFKRCEPFFADLI